MDITLRWMGGAGFLIEAGSLRIGIDLYLSNSCMDAEGNFKRLIPVPDFSGELDYLIASHEHGDHLDMGCLSGWFADNANLKLIGPASVMAAAAAAPGEAKLRLDKGETLSLGSGASVKAVFCDHGAQSPDCIGIVLWLGNFCVYFTSDTCFRADLAELTGVVKPDVLLVPINPAYGNPGAEGAAKIVGLFKPKLTIPCHFWLFKEHGGDPAEFVNECRKIVPDAELKLLAIGEQTSL